MITKYRKFSSNEEYFNTLKTNWNKTVHKRDKVFILGDITMEKKNIYHLLNELNGYKVFILGNHDKEQNGNELIKYGNVAGMLKYKGFWLSHAPIHPQELRGLKNIHGHTHGNHVKRFGLFRDKRYINVCMDVINYTPIEFSKILDYV